MNNSKLAGLWVIRFGVSLGLAMLFLAAVLWVVHTNSVLAVASPPPTDQKSGVASNGSVITIGVAADLTGFADFLGWPQANAVQLAISQTNAAGGINIGGITRTLTITLADSSCNPSQAITAANALVNAGAVAIVGHTCSDASNAVQSIYSAAGVAMVSASATAPGLTEQGYTTTFRVISRDDTAAILLATYFRQWLGLDKAAIIELNGFFGNFADDTFENTFTGLSGTITSRRTVASTADYTSTLTAIQAEGPEVIFYADLDANNAGLLSKTAHNLGMTNVIVAWDTFNSDEAVLADYATAAGAGTEGDHAGMHLRRTQDMPGYDDLNAAYQAAGFANFGTEATIWGALAYDAAQIIIAAIERADSNISANIRNEIAATPSYQGVVGTYEGFDAKGDVIPQWNWIERYQDGQWVILNPTRIFLPTILKNS